MLAIKLLRIDLQIIIKSFPATDRIQKISQLNLKIRGVSCCGGFLIQTAFNFGSDRNLCLNFLSVRAVIDFSEILKPTKKKWSLSESQVTKRWKKLIFWKFSNCPKRRLRLIVQSLSLLSVTQPSPAQKMMYIAPVTKDGTFLTEEPAAVFKNGTFAKVPFIIGVNNTETSGCAAPGKELGFNTGLSEETARAILGGVMGMMSPVSPGLSTLSVF